MPGLPGGHSHPLSWPGISGWSHPQKAGFVVFVLCVDNFGWRHLDEHGKKGRRLVLHDIHEEDQAKTDLVEKKLKKGAGLSTKGLAPFAPYARAVCVEFRLADMRTLSLTSGKPAGYVTFPVSWLNGLTPFAFDQYAFNDDGTLDRVRSFHPYFLSADNQLRGEVTQGWKSTVRDIFGDREIATGF